MMKATSSVGAHGTAKEQMRLAVELVRTTVERWSEVEGFRLGAAFSFYATFAIFPLLLLAVTVIGFLIGDDAAAREHAIAAVASPAGEVRKLVEDTLSAMQNSRSGRGASVVVGVATLLFSASGAMVELDVALNRIWRVRPRSSENSLAAAVRVFVHERLSAFAIVAGLGVTMLASLLASSLLQALVARAPSAVAPALLHAGQEVLSLAVLSGVFAAAFHFIPRSRPPLRDVAGGAILTAVLVGALRTAFASYLAHLTRYSAYGIVGGVLALATWIYLSSQLIFLGAQLTGAASETFAAAPRTSMPRTA